MEKTVENKIEIYKSADGMTEVAVRFGAETVWLNQYQLSELFDTDRTSILKHLKNIYESGELDEQATCAKIAQVRQEGRRKVTRQIFHYNLDAIISVGYRVNSLRGTQFRLWATKRLNDYLVQGYAVNEKRLAQKQQRIIRDGYDFMFFNGSWPIIPGASILFFFRVRFLPFEFPARLAFNCFDERFPEFAMRFHEVGIAA